MKTLAVVFSVSILILLAGCSQAEPTPDTAAVEATVAQRIFATLTASAPTATPKPADTPVPTPMDTPAPAPTDAPPTATPTTAIPTDTPLPPAPTDTPEPTATPTQVGPSAEVKSQSLNVRAGPGTNHPIVGSANQGNALSVLGRTEDGSWLNVQLSNGDQGWVSASLLDQNDAAKGVEVAAVIPTSPPTPTPAPTATPLPPAQSHGLHDRQVIGPWEIQPERLHKEKVVHLYGEDYVAMGNYAIVIVLAKNLGPGTDRITETTALYLRDDKGRIYDYSDPLTVERYANIAASWQFVVHPTPFRDIDPGEETPMLMLWDVNPDVESLTLVLNNGVSRVEWDLGNFSNIPHWEKS
ncbi:MAG: SH3 domain-containing protein [Anaerolineae bacterium]|nr:SH3 domain-containing protein [Anaerolineae bacterium]